MRKIKILLCLIFCLLMLSSCGEKQEVSSPLATEESVETITPLNSEKKEDKIEKETSEPEESEKPLKDEEKKPEKEETTNVDSKEKEVKKPEVKNEENNQTLKEKAAKQEKAKEKTTAEKNNVVETEKMPETAETQQSAQQEVEMGKQQNEALVSIYVEDEGRYILSGEAVEIEDGDTVFELLKKVTRDNKIHMEFTGNSTTAYVEGIDNLYEFDKGDKSGWLVYVNGVKVNSGTGKLPAKAGDKIEWVYVIDYTVK